jgi:PIN domain nuclease of toxin-antitoxin system
MDFLVDTHTLLWSALERNRLSTKALRILSDPTIEVAVSAASAWEIATKVRIGKLPQAVLLESDFERIIADAGYSLLSISTEVALRAGRLPGAHKDPFDRMIAAQALALDIPVLTADPHLDNFSVRRIW